jgi:hypothetical protein
VLDEITTAPPGTVVLTFGNDEDGTWAHTRACFALGIVRKRETHAPAGDGYDRIGARLDWADSFVPIHNLIVDEAPDNSIDEQTMICGPQTSMWEIQHKLCSEYPNNEAAREKLGDAILEALRRVGIVPH